MTCCFRRDCALRLAKESSKGGRDGIKCRAFVSLDTGGSDEWIGVLDRGGPDRGISGGKSDEGRRVRNPDGYCARGIRRNCRRLAVWLAGNVGGRGNHWWNIGCVCRRGNSCVADAAGQEGLKRTGNREKGANRASLPGVDRPARSEFGGKISRLHSRSAWPDTIPRWARED